MVKTASVKTVFVGFFEMAQTIVHCAGYVEDDAGNLEYVLR